MIIYDRGSQFIARFWEQLHASLGTHLIHSLAYHLQTDDQTKRVNQILEDMLRACVMKYSGSWDKNLSCAEFSYNNSYQESLKMAPFEEVHDIFHVSQLKKFLKAPVDVVLPEVAPLKIDLTYPEHPIKILDQKSRVTRCKIIKFFKIQWSNHAIEETTWESEHLLHSCHSDFELP
jgi:hypothetical protein